MLATKDFKLEIIKGPFPRIQDDWQGIGYTVRLSYKDREVVKTDYSLGIGHVKVKEYRCIGPFDHEERRFLEAWTANPHANFKNKEFQLGVAVKLAKLQKVTPSKDDVIWSLLMDASPQIYDQTFEDWASELGYDADSRKAERIYKECCDTGRALISVLGRERVTELQEAFQDY